MRVLQIANGYLDKALYKNLFDQLAEIGVENQVFVPLQYGDHRKCLDHNVNVVTCFNKIDRLLFFPKQWKTNKAISALYDFRSIGIIHAHTLFSSGYLANRLKNKYGIPYIVAVRNTDVNLFFAKQPHLRKVGLSVLKNANGIIFLSNSYKRLVFEKYTPKELHDILEKKTYVIPNGIDEYFFENTPTAIHTITEVLKIVYVGDVDENKNLLTTMKAIELLQEEGLRIKYHVIGDVKNSEIKAAIDSKAYVEYTPKSSKEMVVKYLRDADIFVMPSFTETFGLTYVEAMSQGIPVIYTKNQGFDGQFQEGEVGYSVDPHSPEQIAERIRMIRDNYSVISNNCIDRSQKYRWSTIAPIYLAIYRSEGKH